MGARIADAGDADTPIFCTVNALRNLRLVEPMAGPKVDIYKGKQRRLEHLGEAGEFDAMSGLGAAWTA
jgi:hypothetical protein